MKTSKTILLSLPLIVSGCLSNQMVQVPSYYGPEPMGQAHGRAALPDASQYQGEFKDGLFHGNGTLTWANGEQYQGEFKEGLFHGAGRLQMSNGDSYEGNFANGEFSGAGELQLLNGDHYQGEFKNNYFHGQGTFTTASGEQYRGEFLVGNLIGQGRITYSDGSIYQGDVKNWRPQGKGEFSTMGGNQYRGQFKDGSPGGEVVVEYKNGDRYQGGMNGWDLYHGKGRYASSNGDSYEGEFEQGRAVGDFVVHKKSDERYQGQLQSWQYHGEGRLTTKAGDKYEGEFEYGFFSGQGTLVRASSATYKGEFSYGRYEGQGSLTYTGENGQKKTVTGEWKRGQYIGDDAAEYVADGIARLNAEQLLFEQPQRITQALRQLVPQRPGQTDLYFVSFGSYGSQDVFMKEVQHASEVMEAQYGAGGRTIKLINNHQTLDQLPLATVTNLQAVVKGIADKMDKQEDILFLYLTSHGSVDHQLSVKLQGLPLQEVSPQRLNKIIDDSGIKWKVILVSACYSGGFIEPLKDDHSLIISSASADRTSFGCSNDAELTYFGQAFFKEALKQSENFIQAFEAAREAVTQREKQEDYEPSNPQIAQGTLVEGKLVQLRKAGGPCSQRVSELAINEVGPCNNDQ